MTEESRSPRRRVAWVGVGAAVAVVVAAAAVVANRGDDDGDGGGCLSGLAGNVPVDPDVISGSDLDRARAAGLDVDGSLEDAGQAVLDTGVQLDPLTQRRFQFLEESTEGTGYAVADVRCWVGEGSQEFVAEGSFEREAVTTSAAGGGATVVRGDVLALAPTTRPRRCSTPRRRGRPGPSWSRPSTGTAPSPSPASASTMPTTPPGSDSGWPTATSGSSSPYGRTPATRPRTPTWAGCSTPCTTARCRR